MGAELDDNEEAEVARLLQEAGPHPPVPELDRARIRAASRAVWRVKVDRERSRRLRRQAGWLAAAGLSLAAAYWLLQPGPARREKTEEVATLERVQGQVESAGRPVAVGAALDAGIWLETGGAGRAALRLAGGGSLRLDHGTRLRLLSPGVAELGRGRLYFDSLGRSAAMPLAIATPLGRVRDIGTCFELAVGQGEALLELRVREGRVLLENGGQTQEAAAGFELRLVAGGQLERRAIRSSGAAWEWAAAMAPTFDIEGRPLRAYLDHHAREAGFLLRFADGELAARAERTLLHGDIEGLERQEALDFLLAGSDLAGRLDGETLVIEARRR